MLLILAVTLVVSVLRVASDAVDPTALQCSGENIVYDACPGSRPLYCKDLEDPPIDDPSAKCKPRCRCADGYLINDNQKCIREADCSRCTGPNEFFDCGIPCDRACDNLSVQCEISEGCTERCYCKEGFARDENDICIPIKQCKFPKCDDPNAEYLLCTRCVGSCENRSVSCVAACLPGCSCKKGYIHTSERNATCIKESLCKDPRCPRENTEYSDCISQCPAICPGPEGEIMCPQVVLPCQKGCQCKSGYLSSKNGCVLPKDCPPFVCNTRPNEIYSRCGEACTETCESILGQAKPHCKPKPRKCYPDCICKKGYVRGGQFRCVPANKCGSCKYANEEYLECGPVCERTCLTPNPSDDCPTHCVKGCFCKSGFIRNGKKCIKYTDCPITSTKP